MNRPLHFKHRRGQPRLKLVAALLIAALTLAAVPAIASALSAAGRGNAAKAGSAAPGHKPARDQIVPGVAPAPSAVASRSGWSITTSPNPRAPTGQLLFGTCTGPLSCTAVGTYKQASKVAVTLAEQWNGHRWQIERTPNPAGARISVLHGVACSAPWACTAVGDAVAARGTETVLAERWNGHSWRIEPTPNPAGSRQSLLIAVACASRSSCIAVGQSGQRTLAELWNGRRWHIQPTPNPAGAQFGFLDDVSCTSPSACTAVGLTSQGTLAERWNGSSWRIQPTPNPAHGGGLLGVACTSSSSCTAVGAANDNSGAPVATLAERWNGSSWHIQPTPNPSQTQSIFLNAVDCSSQRACTAVGGYLRSGSGGFSPVAERWNGAKWTIQRTPSPGGAQGDLLSGVACSRDSACTAFGFSHGSGTPLTMAQHWNGKRWRLERTRNPIGAAESNFNGVACSNRSACMAVGQSTEGTLAERWNGRAWALERTPSPTGPAASALFGVSCTSASLCTAAGVVGFDRSGHPLGTLAERWNGHRWRIQPTPESTRAGYGFDAVSCTSGSACTAVGTTPSGLLAERWNGKTWKTQSVPIPAGMHGGLLTGVSCTSASSCTAVGIAGFDSSGPVGTIAERWNGTSWRIQPAPTSKTAGDALGAISCTSASDCIAVGGTFSKLLAERWNGKSWTIQATPTPKSTQQGQGAFFNGVSCPTRSACTAMGLGLPPSGPFMLAERWNGTKWSIQPTPQIPAVGDMAPPAVNCPARTACSAVGGYESPSPTSVTLTEQWKASGATTQSVAQPSGSPSPGLACARPLEVEALLHADLGPVVPGMVMSTEPNRALFSAGHAGVFDLRH